MKKHYLILLMICGVLLTAGPVAAQDAVELKLAHFIPSTHIQHQKTFLPFAQNVEKLSGGKVKMSTRPGEHQGLGLSHYLWSSSPLRRYADLVNQRQLLAVVAGERPAYAANDAELVAAMADFEATYSQYAEFQERMEHYWCLRWLVQEGVTEAAGTVDREGVARLDAIPLRIRLADLPPLAQGTAVRVQVLRVDLLEATLEARYAGPVERAMAGTEAAA